MVFDLLQQKLCAADATVLDCGGASCPSGVYKMESNGKKRWEVKKDGKSCGRSSEERKHEQTELTAPVAPKAVEAPGKPHH